jgi:hypothetical protein
MELTTMGRRTLPVEAQNGVISKGDGREQVTEAHDFQYADTQFDHLFVGSKQMQEVSRKEQAIAMNMALTDKSTSSETPIPWKCHPCRYCPKTGR